MKTVKGQENVPLLCNIQFNKLDYLTIFYLLKLPMPRKLSHI